MSFPNFAAAAPAGQRQVRLLEILDTGSGDPLRFAEDVIDWTVTLEDDSPATFTATGFDAESAAADGTATEERAITVPDVDGELWDRIRDNIAGAGPIRVVLREYLTNDLSAPLLSARLELASPSRSANGLSISFTAVSVDPINRDAGMDKFTFANAPGLRGR